MNDLFPERADDARPRWLLREIARISSARRAKYGEPANPAEWWSQIVVVAAELGIETKWEDWQRWPP